MHLSYGLSTAFCLQKTLQLFPGMFIDDDQRKVLSPGILRQNLLDQDYSIRARILRPKPFSSFSSRTLSNSLSRSPPRSYPGLSSPRTTLTSFLSTYSPGPSPWWSLLAISNETISLQALPTASHPIRSSSSSDHLT